MRSCIVWSSRDDRLPERAMVPALAGLRSLRWYSMNSGVAYSHGCAGQVILAGVSVCRAVPEQFHLTPLHGGDGLRLASNSVP
jgi:hypothetical protein